MSSILERYVGRTITARSASDDIDLDAIFSACSEICSKASQLSNLNNQFYGSAYGLTTNTLSVDNITFEGRITECCEKMAATEEYINSIAEQIMSESVNAYNNLQQQYNEIAEEQDRRNLSCTTQ